MIDWRDLFERSVLERGRCCSCYFLNCLSLMTTTVSGRAMYRGHPSRRRVAIAIRNSLALIRIDRRRRVSGSEHSRLEAWMLHDAFPRERSTGRKTNRDRDTERGKERGFATHFVLNEVRYRRPAVYVIAVFGVSRGSHGCPIA